MAARHTFPAGLALDAHKQQACGTPIVELPMPAQAVLALDQGTGYSAEPVVTVGETVAAGTLVARAGNPYASAVHASLAGVVVAIETREAAVPSGRSVCIVIDGDGSSRIDDSARPVADLAALSPEELVQRLRDAGIAGLGGAGFPTATKLASARNLGAQTLVLNGAECEPWICCDDALMRCAADDVVLLELQHRYQVMRAADPGSAPVASLAASPVVSDVVPRTFLLRLADLLKYGDRVNLEYEPDAADPICKVGKERFERFI